jgi:hypothetical protein
MPNTDIKDMIGITYEPPESPAIIPAATLTAARTRGLEYRFLVISVRFTCLY